MIAEIIKIHPPKTSRNGDTYFRRIEFKLPDGSWAKTDLCSGYRNFDRWRPIIEKGVGTRVKNLQYRSESEVDADSWPEITT